MSSSSAFTKYWMVGSNLVTAVAWCRVFLIIVTHFSKLVTNSDDDCLRVLSPATNWALYISMMEIVNCLAGFTRSPLPAVLLFSCTRLGVEKIVSPLIPCNSWQHLMTVASWSLGDTVRFGSFAVNTANPNVRVAKTIRFMLGPILFPIGAFGEMMMVIAIGQPKAYVAAALWPVFFYPMMKQLLKQRRKHFEEGPTKKKKAIKAV
jgi:hypothetical protein